MDSGIQPQSMPSTQWKRSEFLALMSWGSTFRLMRSRSSLRSLSELWNRLVGVKSRMLALWQGTPRACSQARIVAGRDSSMNEPVRELSAMESGGSAARTTTPVGVRSRSTSTAPT